jgi:hypothetical protein
MFKFLYLNFFSASFCITFLSEGTATSINMQILPFLFWIITSGPSARTSVTDCNPWFHNTVTFSCSHADFSTCAYQFILFQCLTSCISNNADVHRLFHVSLCTHSLPKWHILMLNGQQFLHIPYIISIYSQYLLSNFSLKIVSSDCLILSCHYCVFCFSLYISKLQPLVGVFLIHQSFV